MQKGRWAVVVAAMLVAGVAVTASLAAPSRSAKDKTYYFIPKDTLNPYEVIADRGGKLALTELGDKQVVASGTEDTAVNGGRNMHDALTKAGVKHIWSEDPGYGHDYQIWRQYFSRLMQQTFRD